MTDNTPDAPAVALLPCPNPWCESTDVATSCDFSQFGWLVICSCSLRGPVAPTEAEAISLWNTRPTAALPSEDDVERVAIARCIAIAREVRDGFLSPEYATDQPLSSMMERFACDQVVAAIEAEFTPANHEPQ